MLGPVVPPHGPTPCRLAILAEAPGPDESEHGIPLVGPSGRELRRWCDHLGVSLDNIWKGNVFSQMPPGNDLAYFTTDKPSPASRALGPLTTNPTGWLKDEHLHHLDRCTAELVACAPNVIVALGNTASWFLLGRQGISSIRGTVHACNLAGRQVKVIPTYHPAAVLRQYSLRTIAIADLEKALAESTTPELRYDRAEIWTAPSLGDLEEFGLRYLEPLRAAGGVCALDVETRRGQLTCVGISASRERAMVVPFWTGSSPRDYWAQPAEEAQARRWLARWIEDPGLLKVTQNGLYDIQYLAAEGFRPRGFLHDTMIAHHSLWSELPKSLEFLGATFANYPSWKGIRRVPAEEQLKRDE